MAEQPSSNPKLGDITARKGRGFVAVHAALRLARAENLPANRYRDVLSSNVGHTAWVGNIPDTCASVEGLTAAFKEHGINVLRAVVSDCPDEHVDDGMTSSDDDGSSAEEEEEWSSHWWALVLFESRDAAAKARNRDVHVNAGYGEVVRLHVERVQLREHLHASLELDEKWATGSMEHNPIACRKSNLLASAWRELCTVRVDHLSKLQADETRLHDVFGFCGELLEISTHEPTDRMDAGWGEDLGTGYWALLRFHHPESAGRAMTTEVQQSGNDLHEDARMHVLRPAGLWHSDRWRKLNNHRKRVVSWTHLARSQDADKEVQKRARSRSVSRMRQGSAFTGGDQSLSDHELHRLEDDEDNAVAYGDDESVLSQAILTQSNDEGYVQTDEVFAVLRRRAPTSDERQLQCAVAGARGQPMYLCKYMNTGLYRWVSYHVLSHSVVAMGLVHEFEERLLLAERQSSVLRREQATAMAVARTQAAAEELVQEIAHLAACTARDIRDACRRREIEEAAPVLVGPRAALLVQIMRFGRPEPVHNIGEAPKKLWPNLDQSVEEVEEDLELHRGSGDVLAVMETMELAIALRAVQFGVVADPRHCRADHGCVDEADIVDLVVAYNTAAVQGLGPGQHARDTLWKAELLCAESKLIAGSKAQIKLRATTLNNLACCYRGMNQPHSALKYWKQTLSLQEGLAGSTLEFQRAGTHLNLAELYASTRYYHGAVRHAQTAVGYLLRRFQLGSATRPGGAVSRGAAGLSREDVRSLKQQATTAPRRRKLALLVAALDRLASSLLGMRRRAEASLATQTAAILRAALVGDSPTTHEHRQARPGSLPALEQLSDSTEPQKRRHSSAAISRASAPLDSGVHLPALRRHRFP